MQANSLMVFRLCWCVCWFYSTNCGPSQPKPKDCHLQLSTFIEALFSANWSMFYRKGTWQEMDMHRMEVLSPVLLLSAVLKHSVSLQIICIQKRISKISNATFQNFCRKYFNIWGIFVAYKSTLFCSGFGDIVKAMLSQHYCASLVSDRHCVFAVWTLHCRHQVAIMKSAVNHSFKL